MLFCPPRQGKFPSRLWKSWKMPDVDFCKRKGAKLWVRILADKTTKCHHSLPTPSKHTLLFFYRALNPPLWSQLLLLTELSPVIFFPHLLIMDSIKGTDLKPAAWKIYIYTHLGDHHTIQDLSHLSLRTRSPYRSPLLTIAYSTHFCVQLLLAQHCLCEDFCILLCYRSFFFSIIIAVYIPSRLLECGLLVFVVLLLFFGHTVLHAMSCSLPRLNPLPPTVEAWISNHWLPGNSLNIDFKIWPNLSLASQRTCGAPSTLAQALWSLAFRGHTG